MSNNEKNVNEFHLEMIQNVITRMGQNSFHAKEWCVTLVSALIAFSLANKLDCVGNIALYISLVVTFIFCVIDTYYLYLERGYRSLYKMAANISFRDKDFKSYSLDIPQKDRGFIIFIKALFSISTGAFYILIFAGIIVLLYVKY